MLFAQYIQILHRHISLGMNQVNFTSDFLCCAFNLNKVDVPSPSSCKRFYAGKTQGKGSQKRIIGDTIGSFALKNSKIDETEYETRLAKLQTYLIEIIEKTDAASQLANAFRKEIPDISSVDVTGMAEKLSKLFFRIINDAISDVSRKKGDSLHKPNNVLDAIPFAVQANINEKINGILIHIDIMLECGKEIASWQNRHTMSTPYSHCPSWQKIHDHYECYQTLNIELRILSRKYHIELLEPAILLSERFSVDSFWRCNSIQYCRTWDTLESIEDYKRILSDVSTEIEKGLI